MNQHKYMSKQGKERDERRRLHPAGLWFISSEETCAVPKRILTNLHALSVKKVGSSKKRIDEQVKK
jgi:hypothetical protein